MKQKVRGIRDVERQIAHKQDDEARFTRSYCIALREALRDDGKYPLADSFCGSRHRTFS